MSNKFERERWHYPILKNEIYLDTSTMGLIPKYAADVMTSYLENRVNFSLDIDDYHMQWEDVDEIRKDIAKMIGAECKEEIAFGQNSSTLFNIFTNGLNLKKGDNVIIYDTAFPAMTYVWLNLQEAIGIEIRVAKSKNGEVLADDLFRLADENTKAVTVCYVDSGTGYRHDLAKIGNWCREKNISFGVDATQACGAMKLDVKKMKIDFLTTSSYKWLQGIQGIGFAFIDNKFIKKLNQFEMGWANVSDRINGEPFNLIISKSACRFENGGLPIIGIYGLHETVKKYLQLKGEDIENYILDLTDYLYEKTKEISEISIAFPHERKNRSGLISIYVPEYFQLSEAKMRMAGVRAKVQGKNRIRIGIHYYNNKQDIDCFLEYLKSLIVVGGNNE